MYIVHVTGWTKRLAEVLLEVLGHPEGLDLLVSEDGRHQLVGGEPLLVGGVLEDK